MYNIFLLFVIHRYSIFVKAMEDKPESGMKLHYGGFDGD